MRAFCPKSKLSAGRVLGAILGPPAAGGDALTSLMLQVLTCMQLYQFSSPLDIQHYNYVDLDGLGYIDATYGLDMEWVSFKAFHNASLLIWYNRQNDDVAPY
jgi:hypothetical protein